MSPRGGKITLALLVLFAAAILPAMRWQRSPEKVSTIPASPSGGAGSFPQPKAGPVPRSASSTPGGPLSSVEGSLEDRSGPIPLTRLELYRALPARKSEPEIRALVTALHQTWGKRTFDLVDGDFWRAIEEEETDLMPPIAGVLALLPELAEVEVSSEVRLRWIEAIELSDAAAGAVRGLILSSGSMARQEAEAVVSNWKARGWESEFQQRVARELLLFYADRSRDLEFFRPLLRDRRDGLRQVAMMALIRVGGVEAITEISSLFAESSPRERARWAPQLLAALPPSQSVATLLDWHDRWPQMSFADSWMAVGYRDGGSLIEAYERSERGSVRRDVLIGWSSESLAPDSAEAFLSQVLDLDEDPAVRAQALIALGQIDHPRARDRLAEATMAADDEGPLFAQHLASGIRNALHDAPLSWVRDVAIPYAARQILGATDQRRPGEVERWRTAFLRRDAEVWTELERSLAR